MEKKAHMSDIAVLFIHGFIGHPDNFNVLDGFFNGLGYDTHSFLLSGHFENIKKDVKFTDWIIECKTNIELLKNSGYKKVILVGHSMGGVLSSIMAIQYPKFVHKLILINPAFEYLVMENGKIKVIPSLKKSFKIINDVKEKPKSISRLKYPIPPVNEFVSLIKNHSNEIYKVKCPILFIQADKDNVVPIESIKKIYNSIDNKNKKFITVKNGPHWFLSVKIDEIVFEDIVKFINNKPSMFERLFSSKNNLK